MEKKPLHFLILEDNPDDAELAVKELERGGFTLEWSRVETEKAFRKALDEKPDLILADYKLPSFSGLAALEIRRKLAADIPSILVSGTIGEEVAAECMKAGATDYVLKDRLFRLVPVVKRALKEAEEHRARKQAEEELIKTRERLELAMDAGKHGFWDWNLDTDNVYFSPRYYTMLGYEPGELPMKLETWVNLMHPDDQKTIVPEVENYVKNAQPYEVEFRLKTKDGNWKWISGRGKSYEKDKDGIPHRAIGVHVDITERKKTEEALNSSEGRLRILFEFAPDAYYLNDLKGTFIDGNKAAEDLMGYKREELIGKSFLKLKLISKKEILKASKLLVKNVLGKGTGPDEFILNRKDGSQVSVEIRTYPVQIKDKTVVLGIARDITERKRAEEALRESEKKHRRIFENIQDIYYESSLDGTILEISPSIENVSKYKRKELIGRSLYDIYTNPEERDEFVKLILDKGKVNDFEISLTDKDGSQHPCLITTLLVKDEQGNPIKFVGSIHDISERKQAEEEKKRLQAQLLQAMKMEAIGILAGGVAHDFNNILTVIQGYADLAMMKLDEADPLYRDLKQIDISSTRAANLTRQLLLFSRRQPMEFTSFNLNTTVDNLLKMLHRLIGEDIAINTELDPELWTVQADAGNIEQVIMNLTVNARDAMPEGGTLTIKTENMHVDKKYCKTYTYARPGRFVYISVQDTGVGMDKETTQHIFEPFFTTKGTGKGTGMGLSVVYGIVKQHEGWVNVYSEPGQGSTFKIYLPASSLKAEEETKETISLESLKGSGERILLVEDEEGVREFAAKVLGANGYVVYDAANAEEALNTFDKEAGNFNLIFSDVVLPGKTGLELVDQLLTLKGELRILLSSGYTDHKSQWPVIRERGFRFLEKPYGLTDLLRAIREAIEVSAQ